MAAPASSTERGSWRRISAEAQRCSEVGRPEPWRADTRGSWRTHWDGRWLAHWPTRVVPARAAMAVVKMKRSRITGTKPVAVAHRTRPETFSGCRFQSSWEIGPPME